MADAFISPGILALSTFRSDVKRFLEAGAEALSWLSSTVEETGSFEAKADYITQVAKFGLTSEGLSSLIKVGHFFYDHSRHMKLSPERATEEIRQAAIVLEVEFNETTLNAIKRLLAPKANYDRKRAIDVALVHGPSRLVDLSLAVDVRAVRRSTREELDGFTPIIIGRIEAGEDEKSEHLDFSLSVDKLREIKEKIDETVALMDATLKELKDKLL